MKILHVVGGDLSGGAARGAYWLHNALIKDGVKSKLIVSQASKIKDPNVIEIEQSKLDKLKNRIRSQLDQIPLYLYRKRDRYIFSPAIVGYDITKTKQYREAAIIHFHWINGGLIDIKLFAKIKKPIVWTFRDMWPFTGGCHYSGTCEKFKSNCGRCPHLGSNTNFDLSRYIIRRKKHNFRKNIYPVAISNWLKECAAQSSLFKNTDIKIIPNCIDTEVFYPMKKELAKEVLRVPSDKQVILFGAINSTVDKRKGFKEFMHALHKLKDKQDYYFLIFGSHNSKEITELGVQCKCLGHLSDNITLTLAYSAADVFVAPLLQEAFGKTVAEALSCGTPVVAFNATGPKDIIEHRKCGYLATPFDTYDLAKGIEWLLSDKDRLKVMSDNSRNRALTKYSTSVISKKYIQFYQTVLERERHIHGLSP